jgi:hypothetical protein
MMERTGFLESGWLDLAGSYLVPPTLRRAMLAI